MPHATLPVPGMGTYRLTGASGRQAMLTALELGYRHLDTAVLYNNESDVGAAMAASGIDRGDLFITTKVWHTDLAPEAMRASLNASLKRLGTDYVDLLLVHWPPYGDAVPMADYLPALKALRDSGKTRHIGVSNFTRALIDQAVGVLGEGELLTNQIEVHPFMHNNAVVEHCQQHGIAVTAYVPLAIGQVMQDATLNDIAQAHQISPAQVALAWLHQRNIVPIPASSKRDHLQANLDAMTVQLSDAEMARIGQLDRGRHLVSPGFAPQWD
ncbi:aldo/keto reductase [Saccharospirillum mangrovi]|uniref:aldo/keto reductase n=1 Tax=Saccharospirillum mangrovi TaxID=2161747 RepID=UPI000D3ADE7E|nr:aldo/keto reductase [Saccharospirillum mangrovi]